MDKKIIAEFKFHMDRLGETITLTVKGYKTPLQKQLVDKYNLMDKYAVDIERIVYPPGYGDEVFDKDELELLEDMASSALIGDVNG